MLAKLAAQLLNELEPFGPPISHGFFSARIRLTAPPPKSNRQAAGASYCVSARSGSSTADSGNRTFTDTNLRAGPFAPRSSRQPLPPAQHFAASVGPGGPPHIARLPPEPLATRREGSATCLQPRRLASPARRLRLVPHHGLPVVQGVLLPGVGPLLAGTLPFQLLAPLVEHLPRATRKTNVRSLGELPRSLERALPPEKVSPKNIPNSLSAKCNTFSSGYQGKLRG